MGGGGSFNPAECYTMAISIPRSEKYISHNLKVAKDLVLGSLSQAIPHYYWDRYPIVTVLMKDDGSDRRIVFGEFIPAGEQYDILNGDGTHFAKWERIVWSNKPAKPIVKKFSSCRGSE